MEQRGQPACRVLDVRGAVPCRRGRPAAVDHPLLVKKEFAQFSFRNVRHLSAGAAKKLAWAGLKISLIELESVDFLRKLARPALSWAELRTTLYAR